MTIMVTQASYAIGYASSAAVKEAGCPVHVESFILTLRQHLQ